MPEEAVGDLRDGARALQRVPDFGPNHCNNIHELPSSKPSIRLRGEPSVDLQATKRSPGREGR